MGSEDRDPMENDAEIVRRVVEGDRQAYVGLVRRYQVPLRSVLSSYCQSAEEVEEFLQQAFVQAWAHLHQYDPRRGFFGWLKAIAINALRMEIRRHKGAKPQPAEYLRLIQMARVETDGDGSEAEARATALQHCLKTLSKPQADLLVAKYGEGTALEELADGLRTTVGALKVRLLRIREALRDCIERRLVPERRG
jgi:RNA polymerase sigma-70 factor (ECF subfamily)